MKTRIAIDRQPAGPEGVPVGSQIIFETGCAYNKRTGEFVFGLSHGVQIVHGSPIYAEEGKDNMTLYAHRGDTHAHNLYGFHHWRASNSGWQVVYDRVLSTLVFYDHGSKTIVIWTIKTTEFEGEVAPGVEREAQLRRRGQVHEEPDEAGAKPGRREGRGERPDRPLRLEQTCTSAARPAAHVTSRRGCVAALHRLRHLLTAACARTAA